MRALPHFSPFQNDERKNVQEKIKLACAIRAALSNVDCNRVDLGLSLTSTSSFWRLAGDHKPISPYAAGSSIRILTAAAAAAAPQASERAPMFIRDINQSGPFRQSATG